jgi:hypothetical protein
MTQDKSWGDLYDESGESAGPLPDAEYDFVIRKVTSKKTGNGKPMYMARCEVENGQYAGDDQGVLAAEPLRGPDLPGAGGSAVPGVHGHPAVAG